MIRQFAIGLISLSLAACGVFSKAHVKPLAYQAPPADVPDASLVAACDTSNEPTPTNGALADELARTRGQRNDCATRMDGVRQWRSDAIKRASNAKKH